MQLGEFVTVDASKTAGVVTQKGLLVVRPNGALFAPTEGAVNALGAIGAGLAGAGAGFIVRIRPEQFVDARGYIAALVALPAHEYDAHVGAVWQRAGWWFATPADTRLTFKKVPLFSRYKLVFQRGKDNVAPVFGLDKDFAALAEPIATAWLQAQAAAAAKI